MRRLAIRTERTGRDVGRTLREQVAPTGMRVSEYLQRTPAGETQCTFCAAIVAPAGSDWKEHAALRRFSVAKAGPYRTDSGEFFLIEACCRSCGTLLDTDLAFGDDPTAPRPHLVLARSVT